MSGRDDTYSPGGIGRIVDALEQAWLDGEMEQVFARLRALDAADEKRRKRSSVETTGNVITADFGKSPSTTTRAR